MTSLRSALPRLFGVVALAALVFGMSGAVLAQTVTTIAGAVTVYFDGEDRWYPESGSAANQLTDPNSVAVDGAGYVYIADETNHRIQRFPPGSTSATNGTTVAGGNGPGFAANQLKSPWGVAVDGDGNVYVADRHNHRIQMFPPGSNSATTGTTVAGGNGAGSAANQLHLPSGVAVDGDGNVYIADQNNQRIQKFPPGSTSATNGTTVAGGNGAGNAANQLNGPFGVAVDGTGNMYIADTNNNRIQKFPPESTSATNGTTVAGGNGEGYAANQLRGPRGVAVDGAGNVYVADTFAGSRVQKFPPGSTSATNGTTIMGGNGESFDQDRLENNTLYYPGGVAVDGAGNVYIADTGNSRVLKWSPGGQVNTLPVANAGSDRTVEGVGPSGTTVGLDGTGSSDQDGDPLTYTWTGAFGTATGASPSVPLAIGTHTITLTVDDGKGGTASDEVVIQVVGNTLPVANAGSDQTLEGIGPSGTTVSLDGTGSSDQDWDPLTYTWTGSFGTATGASTSVILAKGSHAITLTVADGKGGTASDVVVIHVVDTTPPVLTLKPGRALWPPNHQYVTLHLADIIASVVDACAGNLAVSSATITTARSDELDDAPGNGDGNTRNDIVIAVDGKSLQLRAERQGAGNGRVYVLTVSVRDPDDNRTTAVYTVTVPRNQSGAAAIDGGAVYSVNGPVSLSIASAEGFEEVTATPNAFALTDNHPNPFNPSTGIAYEVPAQAHITLTVYNLLGQEVVTLVNQVQAAGRYEVTWNARNTQGQAVSSGVYLYRMTTDKGYSETKRMTLLK